MSHKRIGRLTLSHRLKENCFKVCRCSRKSLVSEKNRWNRLNWDRSNTDRPTYQSLEKGVVVGWKAIWIRARPASELRSPIERTISTRLYSGNFETRRWRIDGLEMLLGSQCWKFASGQRDSERRCISAYFERKSTSDSEWPSITRIVISCSSKAMRLVIKLVRWSIKWLSDQGLDWIDNWLPNFLDVNFIENLWDYIDYNLRDNTYSNADQLWEAIKSNVSIEFCEKLVFSLPRRLESHEKTKVVQRNIDRFTKFCFSWITNKFSDRSVSVLL